MTRIILCDDDESYTEILEYKLRNILRKMDSEFTITAVNNLTELKNLISVDGADIIFLDIMIENTNSVEWTARNIRHDIQYVFMTAYPTEAYLISEIENCLFLIKTRTSDELLDSITFKAISRVKKNPDVTIIKSESENTPVRFEDILYVESMGNYIILNMNNGKSMQVYSNLRNFRLKLPGNFIPCHKCYIVNMDYIANYHAYDFTLDTGTDVPIAQKKYKSVTSAFISYTKNRLSAEKIAKQKNDKMEDNDNGNS